MYLAQGYGEYEEPTYILSPLCGSNLPAASAFSMTLSATRSLLESNHKRCQAAWNDSNPAYTDPPGLRNSSFKLIRKLLLGESRTHSLLLCPEGSKGVSGDWQEAEVSYEDVASGEIAEGFDAHQGCIAYKSRHSVYYTIVSRSKTGIQPFFLPQPEA